MDVNEIIDEDSVDRWLKLRPPNDSVFMALRGALRIFPLWVPATEEKWAQHDDISQIPVLRSLLTCGVSAKHSRIELKTALETCLESMVRLTSALRDAVMEAGIYEAKLLQRTSADAASAAISAARYIDDIEGNEASAAAFSVRASDLDALITSHARPVDKIVWDSARADALTLQSRGDPTATPLWVVEPREWFFGANRNTRTIWSRDPETWSFWLRWWDGMLVGKPLDWELQYKVARIPDVDWKKGPAHIAQIIAGMEYNAHTASTPDQVASDITALSPSEPAAVERVRSAITANRDALPPTFDAIEGFISLEIERLQQLNSVSDEQAEECRRQIAVLCILDSAIKRLRILVPAEGEATVAQAEEVEKLSRVYAKHFADWPRSNAADIVDSVCRIPLFGATTGLFLLLGANVNLALAGGLVLFGGKKIGDALKAAKDATK